MTIILSVISLFLSMIFGFILFLMSRSERLYFKYLGNIFNEVIFGTPLLVFVIIMFFFIGTAFGYHNEEVLGILGLSLYMAPYMSNLLKGAMESISPMQYQAMTVFGFNKYQQYRYIILPQLFKIILPPLAGNLTFIIKGSALLKVIGARELFYEISSAQSKTYAFTEGYILMLIMYLLITIPLIRVTKYLEKRVN